MAREKRKVSASGIYLVCLRGNDGVIFKNKCDYDEFARLLDKYFSDGKAVIAYSLCRDSAKLIVMTDGDSIGAAMKPFLTSYARYYNRTYQRTGKVFYDRYVSEPVGADELERAAAKLGDGEAVKKTGKSVSVRTDSAVRSVPEPCGDGADSVPDRRQMDFWLL